MQLRPRASAGTRARSDAGTPTVMHQHAAWAWPWARAACTAHWLPAPHSGHREGSGADVGASAWGRSDMPRIVRAGVLGLAVLLGAQAAWTGSEWFTISGDPARPELDTVQVNPAALERSEGARTLHIRVNRARLRTNWDGVPYRSYTAQVRIRCDERRGEYLSVRLYTQPLWTGEAQEASYAEPRPPMLFRDAQPNPVERIIRAACVE